MPDQRMKPGAPAEPIEALLFDLGNVVLHFDHMILCRKLAAAAAAGPEAVFDTVFTSGLEALFDAGKIEAAEFHREVCRRLGIDLPFSEFVAIWRDIFRPNEAIFLLLERLGRTYRLVLLSNTNSIHFDWCRSQYPEPLAHFDETVLSYRLGLRKPEHGIFRAGLRAARAPAERCVFIDDKEEFVRAAEEVGIHGVVFRSVPALESALESLGVRT